MAERIKDIRAYTAYSKSMSTESDLALEDLWR